MGRYTSQPREVHVSSPKVHLKGNFAKICVQHSVALCLVLCDGWLRFKDQVSVDLSKGLDDVMFGDEAHNFRFVVHYGQATHALVD